MEPNVASAVKPVKIPGPDHPITIEHNPARIIVSIAGRIVADTREALTLREAAYPAVQYIPHAIRVPSPCTTRTCGVCAKFAVARAASSASYSIAVTLPVAPTSSARIAV